VPQVIIVSEENPFGVKVSHGRVPRYGCAVTSCFDDLNLREMLAQVGSSAVGASVIDHDDPIRLPGLTDDARDCLSGQIPAVVGRDCDTKRHHDNPTFRDLAFV